MSTSVIESSCSGVSKEGIREEMWNYLESTNIAQFPRPVHHRIPNFKGAAAACDRAVTLSVFKQAQTVKVNPDKPQEQARFRTLEASKTLLVPTPRLQRGLFNRIIPPAAGGKDAMRICATSQGVKKFSLPIGLDAKVKIDLIVIGSVAVSPQGWRIGKGEGYADMEYAMMVTMGAVTQDTVVVTTVHDCQVKDHLPDHLFGCHDLTVDFIVTPTRTIKCDYKPKPTGIMWRLLNTAKLREIPILNSLREMQRQSGKDVTLKDEINSSEVLESMVENSGSTSHSSDVAVCGDYNYPQPTSNISKKLETTEATDSAQVPICSHRQPRMGRLRDAAYMGPRSHYPSSVNKADKTLSKTSQGVPNSSSTASKSLNERTAVEFSVYVGNIPLTSTEAMMLSALNEIGVVPNRTQWLGQKGYAFLHFVDSVNAKDCIHKVCGMEFNGRLLKCATFKSK